MSIESENIQTGGNDENPFKRRNKKRSRNSRFIANAKGFGKRGSYGRGTQVDEEHYNYFVNILDAMKNNFESIEEKVNMANNVFEQTKSHEINFSSNQVVSKVIENLIGFTNAENFERFLTTFSSNLRPICSDKYASHILQKIIEIAFLRTVSNQRESNDNCQSIDEGPPHKKNKIDEFSSKNYNIREKLSDKHRNICSEFVLKVGKFVLNNLEDFVWDIYGNHIIRTSIISLAGLHFNKISFQCNTIELEKEKPFNIPDEWKNVVLIYSQRLQMWPHFPDFPYNELTSALCSSLCIALKAVNKTELKHFGKNILHKSFLQPIDNDKDECKLDSDEKNECNIKLAKVFTTESSVRLLETLLKIAGTKLFTQLYAMLFIGRLPKLALDRLTNFSVQRLIENVKDKTLFESIFDELSNIFEDLLRYGYTGVVVSLSNTCCRLQTKQAIFLNLIQKALHLTGDENKLKHFVTCLIKLKPYEYAIEDKTRNVSLHGSIIIQNILKFNKPIKMVNCLLNIPKDELITITTTPNGSYIVDAFLESKFIGEKSREKLIKYFDGMYLDMALTKFGSLIVEKLFDYSNDEQKSRIAKELSEKVNQLNSTTFGRILYKKLRIETYRLSSTQWKASFKRAEKIDNLFKDIIT